MTEAHMETKTRTKGRLSNVPEITGEHIQIHTEEAIGNNLEQIESAR